MEPIVSNDKIIMKYILKILIFVFAFTSCGTYRINDTSDFSKIKDAKDLEGYYLNRTDRRSILSCFEIREYADFVTIVSEKPNEIKLVYYSDSTKQEQIFKGKMKKKFFEIYFSKTQFIIPLIYSFIDIDRIRIGKSKDGKLLIRKFVDKNGNLLVITGPLSEEIPYLFSDANEYKSYIPIEENGLWGYSDTSGHVVIPAKYDFARIFECGVASVQLDNKWGLINSQGEKITPLKYDRISKIDTTLLPPIFEVYIDGKTGILDINGNEIIPVIYDNIDNFSWINTTQLPPIFKVYIGEKSGILDINGNEIIPVIYDFIEYPLLSDGLSLIRLGDKSGYANHTGVVVPTIYSEAYYFFGKYTQVKRDGKYYMIDKEGYEYEAKGNGIWRTRTPILNTKRKIELDSQILESLNDEFERYDLTGNSLDSLPKGVGQCKGIFYDWRVDVGAFIPLDNLKNTFGVSPHLELYIGYPLTERYRIDMGMSASIPVNSKELEYLLPNETLSGKPEFCGTIGMWASRVDLLKNCWTIDNRIGTGLCFLQTSIPDPDSKYDENYDAKTIFLSFGTGVRKGSIGLSFNYFFVPYNAFKKKFKTNFGSQYFNYSYYKERYYEEYDKKQEDTS